MCDFSKNKTRLQTGFPFSTNCFPMLMNIHQTSIFLWSTMFESMYIFGMPFPDSLSHVLAVPRFSEDDSATRSSKASILLPYVPSSNHFANRHISFAMPQAIFLRSSDRTTVSACFLQFVQFLLCCLSV